MYFEKIIESRKKPSVEEESILDSTPDEGVKNKYTQRVKSRKEGSFSMDEE